MLAKENRFHGRNSLNHVYKTGQSVSKDQINLRYANNRHKGVLVAVVISKKVHKSSVVRNRIRRRTYEIIRKNLSNIKKNSSLIISVYSDRYANVKNEELEQIIVDLLKKASVLSENDSIRDKLGAKKETKA